jgi:hypothetical protein
LRQNSPKVADNARYYKSQTVKAFLETSKVKSLMTLNFHTLEHLGVCCLKGRNLASCANHGAKIA